MKVANGERRVLDRGEAASEASACHSVLGMASHELKTPLASLKLQAQLLRKKLGKQHVPNMEVVCARMEAQRNALTRLVDELLDLSRIQARKLE